MGKFVDIELEKLKTEDCKLSDRIASMEIDVAAMEENENKKNICKELSDLKEYRDKIREKEVNIERYINGYVRIEAVIACLIGVVFFCAVKGDKNIFSSYIDLALTMVNIIFISLILSSITYAISDSMNKVHIRGKDKKESNKDSIFTTIKSSAIFIAIVYVFMFLIDLL